MKRYEKILYSTRKYELLMVESLAQSSLDSNNLINISKKQPAYMTVVGKSTSDR